MSAQERNPLHDLSSLQLVRGPKALRLFVRLLILLFLLTVLALILLPGLLLAPFSGMGLLYSAIGASIVVEKKKPISLVLPIFKSAVGVQ